MEGDVFQGRLSLILFTGGVSLLPLSGCRPPLDIDPPLDGDPLPPSPLDRETTMERKPPPTSPPGTDM